MEDAHAMLNRTSVDMSATQTLEADQPVSVQTFHSMDVVVERCSGDSHTAPLSPPPDDVWRHPQVAELVAENHSLRLRIKYCWGIVLACGFLSIGLASVLIAVRTSS